MRRTKMFWLAGIALCCSCGRNGSAWHGNTRPTDHNGDLPVGAKPEVGHSDIEVPSSATGMGARFSSKPNFNRAPTASPGRDRYVQLGATLTLDGNGSSDPDGDTLSYAWTIEEGPAKAPAPVTSVTAGIATFVPERAGKYRLQLTVTDGRGGRDARSVVLLVSSPEEPVAAAYAGPNQTVTVGTVVGLDGSQSYTPNGAALNFSWRLRSKPVGSDAVLSGTGLPKSAFRADRVGVYMVDLTVGAGKSQSLPDTVMISAEPVSVPPASPASPAEVVVTNQVIRTQVEPLGMNLTKIAGGTNFATNNFFYGTGFEPLVHRKLIRIDRAGTDARGQWIEWDSDQGPHVWKTLSTGFGNGAEMRFYRLVDSRGEPLEFAKGLGDAAGADHVVRLGEATIPNKSHLLPQGGWMPKGENRVYVNRSLGLRRGDYAFMMLKRLSVPIEQLHERVRQYYRGNFRTLWLDKGIEASLVAHPTPLPTEFEMPGESCLRLRFSNAGPSRIGQWLFYPFDQKEGQWYSQLHPGSPYRFSVWLRHEGSGVGEVRAVFSGNANYASLSQKTPWLVTDRWQKFTYDFVAPPYPLGGSYSGPGLEFVGPGTLFVDNLSLFRFDMKHDLAPNGPHELSLDAWMAAVPPSGEKPAVRFYPLSYQTSSIETLLGNADGNPTYSVNDGAFRAASGVTLPAIMAWAYKTGTAPANRVVPFLSFVEEYTESEWLAIAEYLGVPYDPAVDLATTKPFAHMRYRQRGHGRPWTDEFREILIEYGNETWHNGAGGFGWDGFGAPGAVHQGGAEYGLFARYMFEEHLMKSPAWKKYRLGDKLKLALGANYSAKLEGGGSYGEAAVMRTRAVDYLGHANYVGPKWETNDPGKSVFDAHGLQATLLGMHTNRQLIQDSTEVSRRINGTTGRHYQVEAYEGGPSGYWTNKGDAAEVDEQYGKSLAMGVAALDAWLFSSQSGYSHQCYLGFSSGGWWSSHTMPEAGGFRAHPGWLALTLRNVFARGRDMLAVHVKEAPACERPRKNGQERVPLITAYALEDSSSVSVFVLSRKYPGVHDGVDFGNGYTPVTLRLPLPQKPRRITLHKLSHADGTAADPSENNRQQENIVIHSSEIALANYGKTFPINADTGGTRDGMPPGTVFLYVFER